MFPIVSEYSKVTIDRSRGTIPLSSQPDAWFSLSREARELKDSDSKLFPDSHRVLVVEREFKVVVASLACTREGYWPNQPTPLLRCLRDEISKCL
jgi:hypothetical protein